MEGIGGNQRFWNRRANDVCLSSDSYGLLRSTRVWRSRKVLICGHSARDVVACGVCSVGLFEGQERKIFSGGFYGVDDLSGWPFTLSFVSIKALFPLLYSQSQFVLCAWIKH